MAVDCPTCGKSLSIVERLRLSRQLDGGEYSLLGIEPERRDAANRIQELQEALSELADLVDATLSGDYTPDSFTTQPARAALKVRETEL